MKNQADLDKFTGWILNLPNVSAEGYYGSQNDSAARTIKLQWHGASKLRSLVEAEAKKRSIRVVIAPVSYTMHQVEAAAQKALDPATAAKLGGFKVTMVAGPTVSESQIVVTGHYQGLKANAAHSAVDMNSLNNMVNSTLGLAVRVVVGGEAQTFTTRGTDTAPFNAGGAMFGSHAYACSSGFALMLGSGSYTTTARHCNDYPYHAAGLSSSVYGSSIGTDNTTGGSILSRTGFYWVFDGAWNNSAGYHKTVSALADVGVNDSVCTSGGFTGVHCLLTVRNLAVWFNDGYGTIETILASTTNSAYIAAGEGDSGGPVLIPNTDGTHVWAVGMIQGAPPSTLIYGSSCDRYARDPGYECSRTVLFTSERAFLADMHASLRTG